MRALVKTTAGPGLELIDVPEPRCGPSDVKVRVLRAGLCGTDLHIHDWDDWAASTVKAPLIVGHEFFGEVVEVGEDVPAGTWWPSAIASPARGTWCAATAAIAAPAENTCASTRSESALTVTAPSPT
jgi:threonine dehydrogenase-like Zn-dependent dehydrogenase